MSWNLLLSLFPRVSRGFSECQCGKWVWGPRGQSQDSYGSHREADPSSWWGRALASPSCLCEQKPATSPCLADLPALRSKCLLALRSKERSRGRNQPLSVRRLRGHSLKNIFTRRELSPTSSNYAPIQPAHNGLLR